MQGHKLCLILIFLYLAQGLPSFKRRNENLDCYHIFPSGSKILEVETDGSVWVWHSEQQIKMHVSPCTPTVKQSSQAFTILSYETDVTYSSYLEYNGTTNVPMVPPKDLGQIFHTYATLAQPLDPNDNSTFQGVECVLQFGDFLNGPEFANSWSIRVWYWNSLNINIVTPGVLVDAGDIINVISNSYFGDPKTADAIGTIYSSNGVSQTLEMTISHPITWCASTVEVNYLPSCSGYPPSNTISWDKISIAEDNIQSTLPYVWNKQESEPSCDLQFSTTEEGQKTTFYWNSTMELSYK